MLTEDSDESPGQDQCARVRRKEPLSHDHTKLVTAVFSRRLYEHECEK